MTKLDEVLQMLTTAYPTIPVGPLKAGVVSGAICVITAIHLTADDLAEEPGMQEVASCIHVIASEMDALLDDKTAAAMTSREGWWKEFKV